VPPDKSSAPPDEPRDPRPSLARDLREIAADVVHYRELLVQLTLRDLRIRYKQAVMGIAWAVLTPIVVTLSGWILRVAFGRLFGESPDDAAMAAIAVRSIGWAFFVGALGFGTSSITANLPLVTKVYFPREVLPLASVLTQLADLAVGALLLVVVLPFLGVGLTAQLAWLPLLVLLLVLATTAATLLLSCANVFYRDARHLVQVIVSFGIFFTPVFFDASVFGPRWARIAMLNPLAPILEGMRLATVHGHDLLEPLVLANGTVAWTPWDLAYAAAWAVGGALAGAVVFHRAEFAFAEYV
jgi:ABC-type polysaccharide/polyol phosphate export permease